jgi:regulator of sigma E protease
VRADGCVAEEPARFVVRRDGTEQTVLVRPRFDAERGRPRVGFAFDFGKETLGPGEAITSSAEAGWNVTKLTVEQLTKLVYDEEAREQVSGVVGSYETTRQAFIFDTATAIRVLGLISLSLAIINLFPFLPLDGGHIFWALAEKVRRKPIPFSVMEKASVVGFMLVVALFAIGLTNDIGRLSGEGFQVR